MGCPEDMGYFCIISEEEVAAAIKGLKIRKGAGPAGLISEMVGWYICHIGANQRFHTSPS